MKVRLVITVEPASATHCSRAHDRCQYLIDGECTAFGSWPEYDYQGEGYLRRDECLAGEVVE